MDERLTDLPQWSTDETIRTGELVNALATGTFYATLTQALDEVALLHPPAIVDALFRALLARDGEVACHMAAMLLFVHGKAASIFDWESRPLFLRFNTEDSAERWSACEELCLLIDVDVAHVRALVSTPST